MKYPIFGKGYLLTTSFSTLTFAFTLLQPSVPIPWTPNSLNNFQRTLHIDHTILLNADDGAEQHDPYAAWEEHRRTEPYAFWHRTKEAIEASNTIEFFETFLDDYNTLDSRKCKEKGMGELNCFAWVYTGDSNFECGIDTTYMCRKPSAIEVMTHIQKHWPEIPTHDLVDLGRQAYFASEIVQTILATDYRFYNLMKTIETEALAQTMSIVEAFTPQIDLLRLKGCELNLMLMKWTASAVMLAAQGGSGYFMESLYPGDAVNPALGNFVSGWGGWAIGGIKDANSYYGSMNAPIMTDVRDPSLGEYPELNLRLTRADNHCGNEFGVVVDDNIDHESELKDYIVRYSTVVREHLDREFRTLIFYNGTNAVHSSFRSFQQVASKPQSDTFSQSLEQITQQLSRSFKELLVSKLLGGARSYMKCEEREDAAHVCAHQNNPKNPRSNQSRYCPPNTNVRCQMARWTYQGQNNHEDFVAGFVEEGFEKYGISPQALMENSWKHYQKNRKGKRDWREVLDNHEINDRDELLYIPVCVSKVLTIEEIWPSNWSFENSHWREGFPFSCGDHTSDETPSFLNQININPFKEYELFHTTLPKYLTRIPSSSPVRSYNLLCRVGARWPVWQSSIKRFDTMDWIHPNSIDSHCEHFLSATEGMDEWESNWALCESEDMKWTLKTEHPWVINVVPNPKSHQRQCTSWAKTNKHDVHGERGKEALRKFMENKRKMEEKGMKMVEHDEKIHDGVPPDHHLRRG